MCHYQPSCATTNVNLFCYGSMLNVDSASKSLGRRIELSSFTPCRCVEYDRDWLIAVPVKITHSDDSAEKIALFLDLRRERSGGCNGALLDVSDDEVSTLIKRERQYDLIQLDVETEAGKVVPAWSFRGREEFRHYEPEPGDIVLDGYLSLLKAGVSKFSSKFQKCFWSSFPAPPVPVLTGKYFFADPIQNKAAGRG